MEINANIASTLLNRKFYVDTPFFWAILAILLTNFLGTLSILKIKKFWVLLPSLFIIFLGINVFGAILFFAKIVFPLLYVDLGFLATSAILIIFQYTAVSKEKKFIHESFKKYLSKELIDELMADPTKLKLGGERRKVTVFFSDIRGFTTIAESMSAEELVHIMNDYFEAMSDIIMDSRGLIEKYIGDAIVAFWGAPVSNENQAQDACRSALKMMNALKILSQKWKTENIHHLFNIGVGINTGEVIVGNMGSVKRLNYSIVGDNVNFTSRLEGLNKIYGTNIIISDSTAKEISGFDEFFVRDLDTVIVKGKKEPRHIFELMVKPLSPDILTNFKKGKEFYQKGEWDHAIAQFKKSAEFDPPSKLFLERCQEFLLNPPQDWDGVYEFKTK